MERRMHVIETSSDSPFSALYMDTKRETIRRCVVKFSAVLRRDVRAQRLLSREFAFKSYYS